MLAINTKQEVHSNGAMVSVVAKKKRMEREEPETQLATNDATIKYELGT